MWPLILQQVQSSFYIGIYSEGGFSWVLLFLSFFLSFFFFIAWETYENSFLLVIFSRFRCSCYLGLGGMITLGLSKFDWKFLKPKIDHVQLLPSDPTRGSSFVQNKVPCAACYIGCHNTCVQLTMFISISHAWYAKQHNSQKLKPFLMQSHELKMELNS
jgi:hypothetical protein